MPTSSMKVTSSNISDISYDEKSRTMSITFHDGATYNYFDVPIGVYDRLLTAGSKGSYFAQYIKGRFTSTKVA
jgi:hypothetical protein